MRTFHGARRSTVAGLLTVAAIAILGAGPALAIHVDPTFGPHVGTYGLHTLIDTMEYPAARCEYGNDNKLKTIKIRRPIVFGADRSNGTDTQTVGWRYRIQYYDIHVAGVGYTVWPDLYVSDIKKTSASDLHNARFLARPFTFGSSPTHSYYRVNVSMLWYYPSATHKDGSAIHLPNYYFETKGTLGYAAATDFGCPSDFQPPPPGSAHGATAAGIASTQPAVSGDPTVGPHSGNFGVHTLIDSFEYPGATCVYGSDHLLKKITFRRPIVFGVDRSGGTDTQSVGYKPTIEYYDGAPPNAYANWPDVHVGSLVKVQATDQYNAQWLPGSYNFGSYDVTQHTYYRVSYTLLWFYPSSSHKDGQAVHVPLWYGLNHFSGADGESPSSNGCVYADNVV